MPAPPLPMINPVAPQPQTQQIPLPTTFITPPTPLPGMQFVQRNRIAVAQSSYTIQVGPNTDFIFVVGHIRTDVVAISTAVSWQFNDDGANNYSFDQLFQVDGTPGANNSSAATGQPQIANVPGSTADASQFGWIFLWFVDLNGGNAKRAVGWSSHIGTFNVHSQLILRDGFWNQNTAVHKISLFPTGGGNFVPGCLFKVFSL